MSAETPEQAPRISDPLVNTDPPVRLSEWAAKPIPQQFGPISAAGYQPDGWLSDGSAFVVSGRGHGKRAAQAARLQQAGILAPGQNLDDLDAPGVYRISSQARAAAGRHYAREHWLKRLFLRGRS